VSPGSPGQTANPSTLLERLAGQLRGQIAPAVDDEYQRTQAFMAAVILERLAREAALGERHRAAEAADMAQLATELNQVLDAAPASPTEAVSHEVRDAMTRLQSGPSVMLLTPLVEALYRWGPERHAASKALAAIRQVLRRDINRRMEIAR
jgi:hypothetical protein